MAEARRAVQEITELWKGLAAREKAILGLFAAAVLALVLSIIFWAGRPDYSVLVSGASDEEIQDVLRILEEKGEEYRIEEPGSVLVPGSRKPVLAAELAQRGTVPGEKILGFEEILDRDTFYTTRDRRRLMMRIALQNELALMIANLKNVKRASVLIKEGKEADIFGEGKPAGASVSVYPASGTKLTASLVNAVTGLVKSAVPNIDPADVTVVDARSGRVFEAEETPEEAGDARVLSLKKEVEKALAAKVRSLFVRMGMDAVVVVNAELDLSRRREEGMEVDPQKQAILTEHRSKSSTSRVSSSAGVVGAEANRATGTVVGAGTGVGGPAASAPVSSTEDTRDNTYTYSYKVQETVHAPRGVVDASASVVVFDRIVEQEGKVSYIQPTQDDLQDYHILVANALGTQPEKVVVKHVPSGFPPPETARAGVIAGVRDWAGLVSNVLLALLALAALFGGYLVLKGLLERPAGEEPESLPEPGADRMSLLQKAIRDQISGQPERIARILSRWIASS